MRGSCKSMDGIYEDTERGLQISSTRALGRVSGGMGYPFYVPGERHENLPAGGFAGQPGIRELAIPFHQSSHSRQSRDLNVMQNLSGTPDRTFRFEPFAWEYATGSDGQFGKIPTMNKGLGRRRKSMKRNASQFADFGYGAHATRTGMGFDLSQELTNLQSNVEQAQDYYQQAENLYETAENIISPDAPPPPPPAPAPSVVPKAVSNAVAAVTKVKVGGIPVVVIVAVAVAGFFIYSQAKK